MCFSYLYDSDNKLTTLAGSKFTARKPPIPDRSALVLSLVSKHLYWKEFIFDVKEKWADKMNVVRFLNKAQQSLRSVKLKFTFSKKRNGIFDRAEIVQKEEATCKTCGEKFRSVKNHLCLETSKHLHCEGLHMSDDIPVVQE